MGNVCPTYLSSGGCCGDLGVLGVEGAVPVARRRFTVALLGCLPPQRADGEEEEDELEESQCQEDGEQDEQETVPLSRLHVDVVVEHVQRGGVSDCFLEEIEKKDGR